MLVDADAEKFFVPPYVGHRGWLGVSLDGELNWDELAGIAEDAYAQVASPKLVGLAAAERDRPANAAEVAGAGLVDADRDPQL